MVAFLKYASVNIGTLSVDTIMMWQGTVLLQYFLTLLLLLLADKWDMIQVC